MGKISSSDEKKPLSSAERQKKHIEKLKKEGKYDDYKKKKKAEMKKSREAQKEKEYEMPIAQKSKIIEHRREQGRKNAQKFRDRLKMPKTAMNPADKNTVGLRNVVKQSYSNVCTLAKAVKKATKGLPESPNKKKAVLAKMIADLDDTDRDHLVKMVKPTKKKYVPNSELINDIQDYYQRDDISRASPKMDDVKAYKLPHSDEEVFLPKRHMILTIKEAFAMFNDERKETGKDTCSVSFFNVHRPENVKLIGDLPHDMCLCSYHTNFTDASTALHKAVPSVPEYKNGFIQHFLCDDSSQDCWFGQCNECEGITIEQLVQLIDVPLNTNVSWMQWEKCVASKRLVRRKKDRTLSDLISHIAAMSPHFLRHSYVKREQSEQFNKVDRPRASNVQFADEGLLQIDFAENYLCEAQDEIQSAHWKQRQITLFTSALYHNDIFQSKVFVSDSLTHTKEAIIPYMYKLMADLPKTLKILFVWSDGPSSQFKNKFIASMITHLEAEFNIKIYWNYFATAHGKGCVDGIGATVPSNKIWEK